MESKQQIAFNNIKEHDLEMEKFLENSDALDVIQFNMFVEKFTSKQEHLINEMVKSCGRKNFDNCSNRLLKCGECSDGTKYRQRQYTSHRRWNEFNVFGSKI